MRAGRPLTEDRSIGYADDAARRASRAAEAVAATGARLDRDPNGYCIAKDGRIVARCPNLDAVGAWVRDAMRAVRHAHTPAPEASR